MVTVRVTVRPERPNDIDQVAANHIAAWRVAYRELLPSTLLDELDVDAWAQRRRAHLADPDTRWTTLVAVIGDGVNEVIAGHTTIGAYRPQDDPDHSDPKIGEILAIYAHPDHWGAGVGAALITAALEALPQAEVRLWVLEGNARARRFYERFGLHPDGERALWRPRDSDALLPEIRYSIHRSDRLG